MSRLPLEDTRVLFFVDHIYEDLELWYPKYRLQEAGVHVTIASPEAGETYAGKHGYPCRSDAAIKDMVSQDFHAVLCPGGFMPDKLRRDPKVLELLREFHQQRKLIAAICHGGWLPISAKIYKGVKVTGSLGIKDDLENAGALWVDAPVVIDQHFISSRKPDDLPAFSRAIVEYLICEKNR